MRHNLNSSSFKSRSAKNKEALGKISLADERPPTTYIVGVWDVGETRE